MELDAARSIFLCREELIKILADVPVGFIKPTDPPQPRRPSFKKLGVLVEIQDIVEAKEPQKAFKNRINDQSYSCAECRKILPTAHLLDLHITEQHDFYFAASVERGDKPMFSCFLEECTEKFQSPRKRKDHCIVIHKFPANYRFDQGKDKPKEKRHPKKQLSHSMDVDDEAGSSDTKDLPNVMAFTFGHHKLRTFNSKKDKKSGDTLEDIQSMKDAINDILD